MDAESSFFLKRIMIVSGYGQSPSPQPFLYFSISNRNERCMSNYLHDKYVASNNIMKKQLGWLKLLKSRYRCKPSV